MIYIPSDSIRVTVTGNRLLGIEDEGIIFQEMEELITSNIEAIYFGGAIGTDTVSLKACLDLVVFGRPKLIVVVPNKLYHQPKATQTVSEQADEVIELGAPISVSDGWRSFHNRNEFMVDNSNRVVAFWKKSKKSSGTYSCMKYALKHNKPVKIVEINGEDK